MSYLQYFDRALLRGNTSDCFHNPFSSSPCALATLAANSLQTKLSQTPSLSNNLLREGAGKMFGVLVVKNTMGELGYLAAFSGMLNKQWLISGFVPPVFDIAEQSTFLSEGEARLKSLSNTIAGLVDHPDRQRKKQKLVGLELRSEEELFTLKKVNQQNRKIRSAKRETIGGDDNLLRHALSLSSQQDKKSYRKLKTAWRDKLQQLQQEIESNYDNQIERLKSESKVLSQHLHRRVFETYRLVNSLGEMASIRSLFTGRTPPGGTGDCAAPKLFQFAFKNDLKPLGLAEFWYGGSPKDGVRHHGEFYPPCRGKCQPMLPFMLKGLDIETESAINTDKPLEPKIVFEDADIVVLDKPAGLLSIPGKNQKYSAFTWLADRFPQATGPLLVHRLDMATSGLLLAAKNSPAYKNLQKQFMRRTVEKRYLSVLSKPVEPTNNTIDLPLRVDLDDRPRQMVCFKHGKKAITHFEIISTDRESTRVYFYPVTGRTHQLRVHAAHSKGLSAPIVGDTLYGRQSDRMLLHAERLVFDHPSSGKRMTFNSEAQF